MIFVDVEDTKKNHPGRNLADLLTLLRHKQERSDRLVGTVGWTPDESPCFFVVAIEIPFFGEATKN